MRSDAPNVTVSIREVGSADAEPVDLADRILSLEYDDNALLVDEVSLTVDNSDLAFLDDPRFRLKNEIDVAWGYRGNMTSVRRCVIVELSGGQVLTIRANGQAQWMNGQTKTRRWLNKTRSEVVKEIAAEYGFGTDTFIEDTKVILPQITQAGCTDARFVQSLAKREGFEFAIKRGQLLFHRPKLDQQPIRTYVWAGATADVDEDSMFVSFPTFHEELKGKIGAMAAKGFDPMSKKPTDASRSNADHKEPTLGTNVEVFDRRSGQSLGIQSRAASEHTSPTAAPTEAAARREADAKYRKSRKNLIKLSFSIVGDPDIGARDIVVLSNIGTRLSGKWYVERAKHKPVGGGAYITSLECTRDAHLGYGDPKRDVKANGALNDKEAADDDEKLDEVEVIDRRSGESLGVHFRPRH